MKIFYRYNLEYSTSESITHLELFKYRVLRETQKGYWIKNIKGYGKEKWVPKKDNFNRQFAWDSPGKAMRHLIRRTEKRLAWGKYWNKEFEKAIKIGENALQEGLKDQYGISERETLYLPGEA